jgi:hypothetical protein
VSAATPWIVVCTPKMRRVGVAMASGWDGGRRAALGGVALAGMEQRIPIRDRDDHERAVAFHVPDLPGRGLAGSGPSSR